LAQNDPLLFLPPSPSFPSLHHRSSRSEHLEMPTKPEKRIISTSHLERWIASPAHADVVEFVEGLNESVVGVKLTDEISESEVRCS
jgi:hypothetical protein